MKLLSLYLCLAFFAHDVFCSVEAGPYQTLLYFITYRLEVQALGPEKTIIAAGCKGTVGDGSCYFDEFVKNISPDWKGSTNIGTDLNPDVESSIPTIKSSGYSYIAEQNKLFPSVLQSASGGTFSRVFEAVGDSLEGVRKALGDDKIDQALGQARYAMRMTHETRSADNAKALINGINAVITNQKKTFTLITTTKTLPNGNTFEELDATKTLAACNGCDKVLAGSIKQKITSMNKDKSTQRHMAAIQAAQDEESRLHSAPSC